jgi:hypothetical protein
MLWVRSDRKGKEKVAWYMKGTTNADNTATGSGVDWAYQ